LKDVGAAEQAFAPIKAKHERLIADLVPLEREVQQYSEEFQENRTELQVFQPYFDATRFERHSNGNSGWIGQVWEKLQEALHEHVQLPDGERLRRYKEEERRMAKTIAELTRKQELWQEKCNETAKKAYTALEVAKRVGHKADRQQRCVASLF